MIEYAYKTLNVYNDTNYDHYNNKSHPQKPGMTYWDKHVQPSGDDCVAQLLADVIPNIFRTHVTESGMLNPYGEQWAYHTRQETLSWWFSTYKIARCL